MPDENSGAGNSSDTKKERFLAKNRPGTRVRPLPDDRKVVRHRAGRFSRKKISSGTRSPEFSAPDFWSVMLPEGFSVVRNRSDTMSDGFPGVRKRSDTLSPEFSAPDFRSDTLPDGFSVIRNRSVTMSDGFPVARN